MSTGMNLEYIETSPGEWFYILENYLGVKHGDWTQCAKAYGPFPSQEAAVEHREAHHANPGGSFVMTHDRVHKHGLAGHRASLIDDARARSKRARHRERMHRRSF